MTNLALLSLVGPDGLAGEPAIEAFRQAHGWSEDRMCNELAWLIASKFMAGALSFELADTAINQVRFYSLTREPISSPEPCTAIYLAFDQGEFLHPSESPDLDPVQAYTRPLLTEILARGYEAHA